MVPAAAPRMEELESTGVFYNFPIRSFPHISPKPSIPEHITHLQYSQQIYKALQLNSFQPKLESAPTSMQ